MKIYQMASGLLVKSYSSMKEFRNRKNIKPVDEVKVKIQVAKAKKTFVSEQKAIASNGYFSHKTHLFY